MWTLALQLVFTAMYDVFGDVDVDDEVDDVVFDDDDDVVVGEGHMFDVW